VTLSIVFGAGVIVSLGLWDDIKHIRPSNKIIGQAIAGVILLKGGVGTECLGPITSPINVRLHNLFGPSIGIPDAATAIGSWILVICMVIGCCNATNLLDGLDGLCGGVTAIIAGGFLFLAVHLATFGHDTVWDSVRIVLALALLGAVLGFVPYNFNPASIFMGDTGSMFLGFSCATIIILLAKEQSKWFLAAMVMFALPVLDTALAFTRRWVNKRPLFSADRHHFHHQLVARGFTIRQTVIISYALAIGFCVLGASIAYLPRLRYAVAFYLVIFGSIIVAAYKMGLVHEKKRIFTPQALGTVDSVVTSDLSDSSDVLEVRSLAQLAPKPPEDIPPGP
jgi:UDP-GlcNAc:undecaprenyl-phosphate GlcNAc-1-phosphate transferase